MEVRLLLAFLLMGAVMFLTPYFFKSQIRLRRKKDARRADRFANGARSAAAPAANPRRPRLRPPPPCRKLSAGRPAAGARRRSPSPRSSSRPTCTRVAFSNQGAHGAQLAAQEVQGQRQQDAGPGEHGGRHGFPVLAVLPERRSPRPTSTGPGTSRRRDPDGLGVTYEFSDGHVNVHKVFRFKKESYQSTVSSEVTMDGKPLPAMIQWRGGFGDLTIANPAANQRTLYFDVTQNKLVEQAPKSASKGPVTASGNFSFAGIADTYFAAVFLPEGNSGMQVVTFEDTVKTPHAGDADAAERGGDQRRRGKPLRVCSSAPRISTC